MEVVSSRPARFEIAFTVFGDTLGKENGSDDYQSGRSHDSQCPPNDSLSWCAGYKLGYLDGYRSANVVGGNED